MQKQNDESNAQPIPKRGPWSKKISPENLLSIIDNLPCGIVVNEKFMGDVAYINKAALNLTGFSVQEVPNMKKAYETLSSDSLISRKEIEARWKKLLEEGQLVSIRPVTCKDGQVKTVELRCVVLADGKIVSIWTDISEQEKIKTEIRERERMFRSFFEDCSDPVLLLEKGVIMDCNTATLNALEVSEKKELFNKKLASLSYTDSLTSGGFIDIDEQVALAADNVGQRQFEWVLKKQSGSPFHAEVRMSPVSLEPQKLWYLMLRDISEWKNTEKAFLYTQDKLEEHIRKRTRELESVNRRLTEEIRRRRKTEQMLEESRADLRKLSEHLQCAREEERTLIARDVHDELGQALSVLRIDAAFLKKNLKSSKKNVLKRLTAMEDQIDSSIASVREICTKLRPQVLMDFGLSAGIEWFFRDLQERTGIECSLNLKEEFCVSDKELSLMLFRVVQESVTNILRHAQATRIDVDLVVSKQKILLTIKDNGIGLTEEAASGRSGFGIIGIKERVRFWGGESSFSGLSGQGSCVSVCVPVKSGNQARTSDSPVEKV